MSNITPNWSQPPPNHFLIAFHLAVSPNGSIATLICISQDGCQKFVMSKFTSNKKSNHGEVMTMFIVVQVAHSRHYKKISIEGDSQVPI